MQTIAEAPVTLRAYAAFDPHRVDVGVEAQRGKKMRPQLRSWTAIQTRVCGAPGPAVPHTSPPPSQHYSIPPRQRKRAQREEGAEPKRRCPGVERL